MNPRWCHYFGPFVFHVNHCLKTTSTLGRKGLWNVSEELSIGLETRRDNSSMNKIVLMELITLSPSTGDWPSRLRVWPPCLHSKSSKWTYLKCPGDEHRSSRVPGAQRCSRVPRAGVSPIPGGPPAPPCPWHSPVWSHVLLAAWSAAPELCQGGGSCKPKVYLWLSLSLGILNLSKVQFPGYGSGYSFCGFTDSKCWNKPPANRGTPVFP